MTDEYFMKMALKEAAIAFEEDEVPVGAVVVAKRSSPGDIIWWRNSRTPLPMQR